MAHEHSVSDSAHIILGDCLEEMAKMAEASVDAVVTDPPYALSFMGKDFDSFPSPLAFQEWSERWVRAALRVMKPGAHLVAFGGTRTHHRLMVAMEDAGLEIRDAIMLFWVTGQGFPKSKSVGCRCHERRSTEDTTVRQDLPSVREGVDGADALPGGEEQGLLAGLRSVAPAGAEAQAGEAERGVLRLLEDDLPFAGPTAAGGASDLLQELQRQGAGQGSRPLLREHEGPAEEGQAVRPSEPVLAGRGDVQAEPRQLRRGEVSALPAGVSADGEEGRLRHGASAGGGAGATAVPVEGGGGPPQGSSTAEQPVLESRPLPDERGAQAGRRLCPTCGGVTGYEGWGSALKPAYEPIILARKPLTGTLIGNVLAHGVGGLNVDGCRVEATAGRPARVSDPDPAANNAVYSGRQKAGTGFDGGSRAIGTTTQGRWPANVVLSHAEGCEMVGKKDEWCCVSDCPVRLLDEQSGELFSGEPAVMRQGVNTGAAFGAESRPPGTVMSGFGDSGGASRFFYTAKADRAERDAGLSEAFPKKILQWSSGPQSPGTFQAEGTDKFARNFHPTVKPIDLMRWLIRLVAPPSALILDPFAGSGSTLIAAWEERCRAVGIEKDPEYHAIAEARVAWAARQLRLF